MQCHFPYEYDFGTKVRYMHKGSPDERLRDCGGLRTQGP